MKDRGSRHEEDVVLLLNKGKQGITHLIFGRTGIIILLLAIQIVLLVLAFVKLQELYFSSAVLLSLVVALVEISRKGNPTVKLSWVLLTMAVPVFASPSIFWSMRTWATGWPISGCGKSTGRR